MTDRSFPPELGLTDTEATIASLLATREKLSAVVAFDVLYGDRAPDRQPQFAILKSLICNVRRKLRGVATITTIWGWGWSMPAADRERLKAMRSKTDA